MREAFNSSRRHFYNSTRDCAGHHGLRSLLREISQTALPTVVCNRL
jgi:hypothetical protein